MAAQSSASAGAAAAGDTAAAWLTYAMLVCGPVTLAVGLYLHRRSGLAAPYGRFAAGKGAGWGPLLHGKVAWMVRGFSPLVGSMVRA